MKTVLVVLFVLGLVSLHLQADARKLISDVKTQKIDCQTISNAQPGRKLEVVNGGAPADSGPTVAANNDNKTSNTTASNSTDDVNNGYENYGNPSGSSTNTHHVYTNDCQPKKAC